MKQRGTSLPPASHVLIFGTPMRMLSEEHLDRLHALTDRIRNAHLHPHVPEPVRLMREMCRIAEIRRVY